ncbi:Copper ion binding isoform 3 [Gossypium australe]|uniref:Copper ion binding isoform 3 n=1 Tax=Gossypium australe TaxID=47621 RepID=A0A5B6XAE4_9ROSI|nr:Copper ion binding isoform 3 [Gossypium australe]
MQLKLLISLVFPSRVPGFRQLATMASVSFMKYLECRRLKGSDLHYHQKAPNGQPQLARPLNPLFLAGSLR